VQRVDGDVLARNTPAPSAEADDSTGGHWRYRVVVGPRGGYRVLREHGAGSLL
jgi:hypothetical protein